MLTNSAKIGKLYKLPSGAAVRVVKIDDDNNIIIVHNYHSHSNEYFEYQEFLKISTRLFRISEVAKILGKKSSTIRKYENDGIIPKAEKISLNFGAKASTRVYTTEDVEDLKLFFDRRRPAGRPSSPSRKGFSVIALHKEILESQRKRSVNG